MFWKTLNFTLLQMEIFIILIFVIETLLKINLIEKKAKNHWIFFTVNY